MTLLTKVMTEWPCERNNRSVRPIERKKKDKEKLLLLPIESINSSDTSPQLTALHFTVFSVTSRTETVRVLLLHWFFPLCFIDLLIQSSPAEIETYNASTVPIICQRARKSKKYLKTD